MPGARTRRSLGERTRKLNVPLLRELFRNLQMFEALFEAEGIDTIVGPDGKEYCLADIQYLYSCRSRLSRRQAQAIEHFLYDNSLERVVALEMGVAATNPIAIYATQGLKRLCDLIASGELARYREETRSVEVLV